MHSRWVSVAVAMRRAHGLILVLASVAVTARVAHADEPVAASEPRLLDETAEVTSVVDAFDRDNPFDLHITVGFTQTWKRADIHRETELNQPGLSTGGFVANTENIARYSQDLSVLDVGADIGLFRDLALVFRLPIILSDSRSLGDLDGSVNNPQRLQDPTGATLFKVPFQSPTRSGIDYFSVGLDWAITNQQRDWTKPTWAIGIEGRFGVGDPLHACNATGGGTPSCPNPANLADTTSRSPGVSRAMYSLVAKTVISRRYGYVEPYTGFDALFEFPRGDSDMGDAFNPTNFKGALVTSPPIIGTFTLGMEIDPLGAPRGLPAPRDGPSDPGHLQLTRPRVHRALRRARIIDGADAPHAKPERVHIERLGRERRRYDAAARVLHGHHRSSRVRCVLGPRERDVAGRRVREVRPRRRRPVQRVAHGDRGGPMQSGHHRNGSDRWTMPDDRRRAHRHPRSELSRRHRHAGPQVQRRQHGHRSVQRLCDDHVLK